ncbi:Gag polyprotein, partial [Dissostichus eleginoides]
MTLRKATRVVRTRGPVCGPVRLNVPGRICVPVRPCFRISLHTSALRLGHHILTHTDSKTHNPLRLLLLKMKLLCKRTPLHKYTTSPCRHDHVSGQLDSKFESMLVVPKSNEVPSSVHMEKEGLVRCVQFLESENLVMKTIVTDRHTQINKWLKENQEHVDHRLILAALHYNENSGRKHAKTSTGQLQYTVKFPKAKKDHDRITNDDSEEDEKTAEEKQMGMMQHSFPMVQVAGHDGPSVVYRPWTIKDMKEMMNDHLPDIQQDGEKFSTALLLLCQQFSPTMPEIRKLLTLKIGPTHASHFTQQMTGLHHITKVEWENPANDGYHNAITTLCTAIKAKFPAKVDMSKITACKQNPEESVNDYYHRLHLVFNANSGIQEPDGYSAGAVGVWETHLSNAFLNGLSSAISTSVRASCIGVMDGARLEEIRRHAIHAEKRLSEDKASDDKKRRDRKEKAQLTMVQAVTTA